MRRGGACGRPTSRCAASPRATRPSARRRCPEEVVGRRPAAVVPRGAYLGPGQLVDESAPRPPAIRRGERAVEVAGTGSAELVVAGARVDVVVVPERGGARLAITGAEVLSARALASAEGADAARVAATLRVTARQALTLASLEAGAREVRLLARTS